MQLAINSNTCFFVCFCFFNVPFKIISLIETSQASRNWLVSHVASAGLEPTPDTGVMIE